MKFNKLNLKKIIYNSGDVFLPEKIKKKLMYDIICSHNNTFYISGWSLIHLLMG